MITLTDEILKQDKDGVLKLLQAGEPVNEIDIHGFPPLTEAAIVNDYDIAKLLIEYGADVKMKDLVGGTALQWAVENNNIPLCQLLLDHGADPNAYSKSGQPILVQPLLRRRQNLKELLYRAGADLKFAQDYINAKLIGHRFELVGRVDMVNHKDVFVEMDFEGFILEFTLSVIFDSLTQFKNNFAARSLRPYFDAIQAIVEAFAVACELNRYQQYLANKNIDKYTPRLEMLVKNPLLLLPVGYEGHAITFVKYGNLLAKCDRGANSLRHPSVEIFHIGRPSAFNIDFLKTLLYKRQNLRFVTDGVVRMLGLTPVNAIHLPSQLTGNCSWANVEASIPTMLFMLWLQQHPKQPETAVNRARKLALSIYKQWLEWDKDWALHQCVEGFYDATPTRKAAKAAVLAAVLAQTCRYTNPGDINRANKILEVLTTSNYTYVLQSYLRVFQGTAVGKNIQELHDLYGRR